MRSTVEWLGLVRNALVEFIDDDRPIELASRLDQDLGMDSLDKLIAMMNLEDDLGISLSGIEAAATVSEVVIFLEKALAGAA